MILLELVLLMANFSGRVVDASTQKPVEGAWITSAGKVVVSDPSGEFKTAGEGKVSVRARGYARQEILAADLGAKRLEIKLEPFRPKLLYLSFYGIGVNQLLNPALRLIQQTELNGLVIDVKGDRGMIPYPTSVTKAVEAGANRIRTVKDMKEKVRALHEQGLYLAARIVVFKDTLLAVAQPEMAVRTESGAIWHDREDLSWVDPFRKEVWDYNIDIAEEAARLGFDEIQFDYVRFPDTKGLSFSAPNTEENRVRAVSEFLEAARKRLVPYNVFLAADIFGYACWNRNDTFIGQKLQPMAAQADYLSPMLYPSGFQFGIPGFRKPLDYPYEIVKLTLENAGKSGLDGRQLRPWIQAFRDYAFDRRPFGAREIRAQIKAAEEFGTNGWMLWNPSNIYSADGLNK